MTLSAKSKRVDIAQRCRAVMHQGLTGVLTLSDRGEIRGRVEAMTLNGEPDPWDPWDPTTVTVNGERIALGRIEGVQGV